VSVKPPDRPAIAQALPHARFVFPTAPKQRATAYRRSKIRQWFDDWHLGFAADEVDSRYDLGLQTTGMGRTVAYLHGLIAREAEVVGGTRNVILGGISQGCAVSLVASLLWEGEDGLGGVVGMCGWLPYISQMRGQLLDGEGDKVRISASGNDQKMKLGLTHLTGPVLRIVLWSRQAALTPEDP
jgi:predicted esterase